MTIVSHVNHKKQSSLKAVKIKTNLYLQTKIFNIIAIEELIVVSFLPIESLRTELALTNIEEGLAGRRVLYCVHPWQGWNVLVVKYTDCLQHTIPKYPGFGHWTLKLQKQILDVYFF